VGSGEVEKWEYGNVQICDPDVDVYVYECDRTVVEVVVVVRAVAYVCVCMFENMVVDVY